MASAIRKALATTSSAQTLPCASGRFGVILRKVWGGSRTWPGARAQSVLISVSRTCWQLGRLALDFPSQLLRGAPTALALPP
jgi:hypothetical protein